MVLNKKLQKYLDIPVLFNSVRHILDQRQDKHVKQILNPFHFKSVLDIACGTGDFCNVTDANYVGIDNTPSFIKYCNDKFGSINKKFYLMDATKLQFKKKQFDASLLLSFIHHLPDKLVVDVLRSVAKVTKNKIIIVDLIPSKSNLFSKFFYAIDRGNHMRSLDKQLELIRKTSVLTIDKVSSFTTKPGIYYHSVIICSIKK